MRIVIATFGSLGDLHPAMALAHGLQARGHEAVIATSEPYRAKVTAFGLPFAPVRPDLSLSNPELVRRVMDGQRGSAYLMRELVYPSVRDMHTDLDAIAADADLLLAAELAFVAPIIGARRKLPWGFFALSPISFLSAHDPVVLPGPAFLPWLQSLGSASNRLVLSIARAASYSWWKPLRRFRRELGLPPGQSPLFRGKFSPHLNLALFSRVVQAPQPDWPQPTHQPGFCFFDEIDASRPPGLPPSVDAFLRGGEPPVVFTLGSAAVQLADEFYVHSARAAAALGRRAVLLLGRNPPPTGLPPSILAWDYLPFAQIFPHAAAVVHQGGVGTTGQVLRAGRPMIVVPFAHDQFDNAARVTRLGVARTIPRQRYRTAHLTRVLGDLLNDDAARTRATQLAAVVCAERGIAGACDAVEAAADRPRGARITSA